MENRCLQIATWNARSANNKIDAISDMITDFQLHVLAITETLHENSDWVPIKQPRGRGHNVMEVARPPAMDQDDIQWINHGGVTLVGASGTRLAKFELNNKFNSFEHLCCRTTSRENSFIIVVVYNPGSVQVSMPFFTEFSTLLENISNRSELIVVTGDLNIRLDRLEHPNALKFNKILNDFGLCQHITLPTHDDGGILDVIITRIDERIHDIMVADIGLSNHRLERCALEMSPPAPNL